MSVSISSGNSKMGTIPSISLPAVVTCRKCSCQDICYARKIENLRFSVKKAYVNNLNILYQTPDIYWREVEATVMMSRFFRFHVSGDIPDKDYLERMVAVALRNKHCDILCFTKKYEMVNSFLDKGNTIPENLHMIFSGWRGLDMPNPYSLPEAHVLYNDGTTTAREDAVPCGGNCTECAKTDEGCWKLKKGEQVVFKQH